MQIYCICFTFILFWIREGCGNLISHLFLRVILREMEEVFLEEEFGVISSYGCFGHGWRDGFHWLRVLGFSVKGADLLTWVVRIPKAWLMVQWCYTKYVMVGLSTSISHVLQEFGERMGKLCFLAEFGSIAWSILKCSWIVVLLFAGGYSDVHMGRQALFCWKTEICSSGSCWKVFRESLVKIDSVNGAIIWKLEYDCLDCLVWSFTRLSFYKPNMLLEFQVS
jgi:hypothetical protein